MDRPPKLSSRVGPACKHEATRRAAESIAQSTRCWCEARRRWETQPTLSSPRCGPSAGGCGGIKKDGTRLRGEMRDPPVQVIRGSGKTRRAGAPKHRQRFLSVRPGGWSRTPRSTAVVRGRSPAPDGGPRGLSARRQHSGPSSIRLLSRRRYRVSKSVSGAFLLFTLYLPLVQTERPCVTKVSK